MSPQIVGKGRADSVGVIREVERESESATESCFAQILLSLWVLRDLVAHTLTELLNIDTQAETPV